MRVVIDVETNGLENPDKIWLIVCKDIDTGELHVFRNPSLDETEKVRFTAFAVGVSSWTGHNLLGYDYVVIRDVLGYTINPEQCLDTLILSKLIDYPRQGHSIEDYGLEFGMPKGNFRDFSKYSIELEEYCTRDVEINYRIYLKYTKVIEDPKWLPSITLEHKFQLVVNDLHTNGFSFNKDKADRLLTKVNKELLVLDEDILKAFPPRQTLVREFTPKATKHGTISRTSVPRSLHHCISDFEIGKTYPIFRTDPFNPSSHKQLIQVLSESGWSPTDKTQSHIDTERELNRLRYAREADDPLALEEKVGILKNKLEGLKKSGWKINENNLNTLPSRAPAPARLLAKRILLESRRRSLHEWLNLVQDDGRVHGRFQGLGAWTHRMAHQNPNTANIPSEKNNDGTLKLYGSEMRALWQAPKNRLLVGVDAEGIQLRIFAHYIDDPEFTESLVEGKKDDKSDPHSLNQRVLGAKSRNAAKRFIFAYLLGAGVGKLAQILELPENETRSALDRLLDRYKGLAYLKENIIPADARRGWFVGLDGRRVRIPGETPGERKHLCMSGYLQNGEAVVMKSACLKWADKLKDYNSILVNFIHDEWQTETPNDMEIALAVAKIQADSLREVGVELGLKCPLAGSYYNEDIKDYTVGVNWKLTH